MLFSDAYCQDLTNPEIIADRPGMATGPFCMQKGMLQIEEGESFEHCHLTSSLYSNFISSTLFRYGLYKRTELRIENDFNSLKIQNEHYKFSYMPLIIGSKVLIVQARGAVPTISALVNLAYSMDKTNILSTSFYVLMNNDLSDKISICYNFGVSEMKRNPKYFIAYTLNFGLTSKLACYAGNYMYHLPNMQTEIFEDFGLAYLIRNNIQIDISESFNLIDINRYCITNVGISWKIK